MTTVNEYIAQLSPERVARITPIVEYIRMRYPDAVESLDYAPKTKIPTYKYNEVYVAIASMKGHLSIHFGKYNATTFVVSANPRIKARVGCVNITDRTAFPLEAIYEAIDYCFITNDKH